MLACVSWLKPHPERHCIGKPAELWNNERVEQFGIHSFVPLDHIVCRCAYGIIHHKDENLLLIIPLV